MAKLWQFLQGHPKPAFSEKVQRGDQGKFFKNRPKSSPRLKGPKALWRKWYYPLNKIQLRCKDWTRFRCKWGLQNCPNSQLMAIFATSPKTRIVWKSSNGDQEKFFKTRPKGSPPLKGPKALVQMALSSNLYVLTTQRLEKISGQKSGAKSARMAKLWQFSQGHPKRAFSDKMQRGDQGIFLKNRPKSSSRLKGPKVLGHKSHYRVISIHLKCKEWTRFLRK